MNATSVAPAGATDRVASLPAVRLRRTLTINIESA